MRYLIWYVYTYDRFICISLRFVFNVFLFVTKEGKDDCELVLLKHFCRGHVQTGYLLKLDAASDRFAQLLDSFADQLVEAMNCEAGSFKDEEK